MSSGGQYHCRPTALPLTWGMPETIGVFRNEKLPTLEERYENQISEVKKKEGEGDLKKLLFAGDMWEVK